MLLRDEIADAERDHRRVHEVHRKRRVAEQHQKLPTQYPIERPTLQRQAPDHHEEQREDQPVVKDNVGERRRDQHHADNGRESAARHPRARAAPTGVMRIGRLQSIHSPHRDPRDELGNTQ